MNWELDHHNVDVQDVNVDVQDVNVNVDVQGTKTRIRSCHPAEHGGKPCPEKNKQNLQLYEEKMDCSRIDCESMPAIVVKS